MANETCWTLIRKAAERDSGARERFVDDYMPALRDYIEARWRGSARDHVEDALQEVFVECFRDEGVLERAAKGEIRDFHGFLYGVARNVCMRIERRRAQLLDPPGSRSFHPDWVARDEGSLSQVFDRAWAQGLMRQAVRLQTERARQADDAALRRVRVLQLRFQEGLPIRDIAALWGEDVTLVHRMYARGRREFHDVLREVVSYHQPRSSEPIDEGCRRLLDLLR